MVEGVGDHGCEYMTGGTVVVLGQTGRNFAAGMSGGVAYVLDEAGDFEQRCNMAQVALEPVPEEIEARRARSRAMSSSRTAGWRSITSRWPTSTSSKSLIERHVRFTESPRGREILDNWASYRGRFVKVMPNEYRPYWPKWPSRSRSNWRLRKWVSPPDSRNLSAARSPYVPVGERLKHYKGVRSRAVGRGRRGAGRALHGLRHSVLQQRLPGQQHHSGLERSGIPRRVASGHRSAALDQQLPEFTSRICPAPCEAACTLNINDDAVGIKSIERAIIDKAWSEGWIKPRGGGGETGKKIAIVGSGPAGLAAAQQLARAGHAVVVFEKNDRIGGLLRYGIPDFKMEKSLIDMRMEQMAAEGVEFRAGIYIGNTDVPRGVKNYARERISPSN